MIKVYIPIPLLIASLFVAIALAQFRRAIKMGAIRTFFHDLVANLGKAVLAKVPDQIHLEPVASPRWKDQAAMERLASPLLQLGFTDLGTFGVNVMPRTLIRLLFHAQRHVSAHIYEHPGAGTWIEFATRYNDGSSQTLSTLYPTGIRRPAWVRTIHADRNVASNQLFERLLIEQRQDGIKPVKSSDVVREFEENFARYIAWKKTNGLSAGEFVKAAAR